MSRRHTHRARRRPGRLAASCAALAAVAMLAPSAAGAATAGLDGGRLVYAAAAGEQNALTVETGTGSFVLQDPGALISPGAGCDAGPPSHHVTCDATGVDGIQANLGGRNDTLAVDPSVQETVIAKGGSGADALRGGAADDELDGGGAPDDLRGGDGRDTVTGAAGDDSASLGAGRDRFEWNPGDGSDVVEGQGGSDTTRFTGSEADEGFRLSADAGRIRLHRDVGNATIDADGIESVHIRAQRGADAVTVDDLAGTGLESADLDLAGGGGDGENDVVDLVGTSATDLIGADAVGGETVVSGLSAPVAIANADPDRDLLRVKARGGDDFIGADPTLIEILGNGGADTDTVIASGTAGADAFAVGADPPVARVSRDGRVVEAEAEKLTVDALDGDDTVDAGSGLAALPVGLAVLAGAGEDTIDGGDGNDTLLGGDGNDSVDGDKGDDSVLLGAGDDQSAWRPGDGSDTVEGQDGFDTMRFNGSNAGEQIDLSADGQRLRLTRDVGVVVMDVNGVEGIDCHALGGADTITVHDLTGTAVTNATYDLAAAGGIAGDAQLDTVIVEGTNGDDAINAAGDSSGVSVVGLAANASILHAESAGDTLRINGLAGDDVLDGSGLAAGATLLIGDGGDGADTLLGGDGADTLLGGEGDDVLLGGPGVDVLDGGPGDNIVIQD